MQRIGQDSGEGFQGNAGSSSNCEESSLLRERSLLPIGEVENEGHDEFEKAQPGKRSPSEPGEPEENLLSERETASLPLPNGAKYFTHK